MERGFSVKQFVNYYSERPYINFEVVLLVVENFGRNIEGSTFHGVNESSGG